MRQIVMVTWIYTFLKIYLAIPLKYVYYYVIIDVKYGGGMKLNANVEN